MDLALRELRRDGISDITTMRLDYRDFVHRETHDRILPEGFPGTELEHASLIEPSLMLFIRPELVDVTQIPEEARGSFPPYDIHPPPPGCVRSTGVLADARGSRAEIGRWLMDDHVTLISHAVRKEFKI
jgi:creatinine amidohydrolase